MIQRQSFLTLTSPPSRGDVDWADSYLRLMESSFVELIEEISVSPSSMSIIGMKSDAL